MKQKNVKTAFAIACVVAASVSSFKAYDQHNKNVAAANMLLNVIYLLRQLFHVFAQFFLGNLGIHLGCLYVLVTKH